MQEARSGQRAEGQGQREVKTPKGGGTGPVLRRSRARRSALSLSFLFLTFALCPLPFALSCARAPVRFLSIATGGTGGVYYPFGGALARIVSEELPGVQATAEVTGASVDNLKLMQLGKVDLAFTLADTLAEAVRGTGPFADTGAVGNLRTVAVLYTNYTHIVTLRNSGITRVSDLRGRTVSVGAPGSGTELIADRVLAAAGVDPHAGITRHSLSATESAGAMKDGKLDAFFWSGGLPTPAIQDLAATPGVSMALLRSDDLLPFLQRDFGAGLYSLAVIPAGSYQGLHADLGTIGVRNILVASSQLDEDLVHDIARILFERKDDLVAAHPEARHLERPSSFDDVPAPYHPGALRYYQEK